ncbi:ribonuclease P protein component [Pseudobacteroides cellulosolvens]|uniref:Ribonuclease P protein component n=1 Tax=Pseudobacteroides cellulosolvens ATCC 35603 = DSM 2933 TaxID=398512 RepID=A0A0L6JV99_9FIRM|nr:ribonuclease P protein component [Pseudobacteroides cellulosolvens]KNY29738.1 Ribonuclease P protein component [Pseudobacteroides cellulosolvens ATCC 35603 = DSM 2933]
MIETIPLKKNHEFMRVYKKGRFYVGKYITLYTLSNYIDKNRLGITVSKKVGKSVKRNRIRRLVKENYRLVEEHIKHGFDIVFVVRSSEDMPGFFEIKKEMKYLLKKLNIFEQEKIN